MSSNNVIIRLTDVSKIYHLYQRPADRLKQMIWGQRRQYGKIFQALNKVSFEVQKGEILGVIGRNGAGKSTLLQLLCQTLTPTTGTIEVHGRVAALLELGAGFNPEFTGRENAFLYGAVLGIKQEEMATRLESIVKFADLIEFMDQPVKTYSSGMYVRLAFSIATSVEPDILVVDEALSVGDGEFARKSFDRIMALREQGTTILFCSHSLYQIEALCTRAIWLEKGSVKQIGKSEDVVAAYGQFLSQNDKKMDDTIQSETNKSENKKNYSLQGFAKINGTVVSADKESGKEFSLTTCRSEVKVSVYFASDIKLPPPSIGITIHTMDGRTVSSTGSHLQSQKVERNEDGRGVATVSFPAFPLLKGSYFISVHLMCERGIHIYETADNIALLHMKSHDITQGMVWLPNSWYFSPESHVTKAKN